MHALQSAGLASQVGRFANSAPPQPAPILRLDTGSVLLVERCVKSQSQSLTRLTRPQT